VENILEPKHNRAFQIDCSAEPVGSFRTGADRLSVRLAQRIWRLDVEEIWDSVIVQSSHDGDDLMIRVFVCHPDWDEPIEIACIHSAPKAAEAGRPIKCHLERIVT
jgi:hypothetical protein